MSADPLFNTKPVSDFLFATSSFLSTPFEKKFKPDATKEWAGNNYSVMFACISAYVLFLYLGTKVMKNYKPFDLRYPLALWNAFLCLFSFIGMCRTVRIFILFYFKLFFKNIIL